MKTEQNPSAMASNKVASMVSKNSHNLISILTYAFLEWVLILLLLMNSFLSYFIRRFASYFGLRPPCPWCSRLDHHLLGNSHPYKDLVCQAHAKEISNLTYCSSHQRLAESKGLCEQCLCSETNANCSESFTKCECTCCGNILTMKEYDGGNQSGEHQIISDDGSFYTRELAADDDSNEEDDVNANGEIQTCNSLDEHVKEVAKELGNCYAVNKKEIKAEVDDVGSSTIRELESYLEAERKARNELYAELEAERSAAAIAANQTMAMITRLQEEKAAMQMEALQYQRVMEEQAEYDQQALQLLNDLVAKREREKQELQLELDVYRERVIDYEAKDKALMMIKKCGRLSSPSNLDSESDSDDVLSIDLTRGYDKEDEDEGRRDTSLLECSKEWGVIDDSLGELEEERLSIMRQLRELEDKLLVHQCEEDNHAKLLCSQEVNVGTSCFVENRPKTMASVARNLLDLVVSSDSDNETGDRETSGEIEGLVVVKVESQSKRHAIEKEMDHVYGRLHALEADTEFLRHCIASLSKGNHGANVLQEILEHLRDLRAADICF